ncbi:MAG: hypothetical protein NZ602_14610 [Thermoguttaceae bacterium]|nr:hypothetical protein [Thermoguttaceae bacterium]MDW8036531.1 hypothetical protein [Thermoguttaceae bacterium]
MPRFDRRPYRLKEASKQWLILLGKASWLMMGLAGFLVGCGSSEPFDTIPVSGTLMYEDGSLIPAPQIQVIFIPQVPPVDKKTYPRPGLAYVNPKDGTFANVTSHQAGDGVVVGRAKVVVKTLDERGNPTAHVPKEYQEVSTTPLEVEVSKENRQFTFKIKKPIKF